METVVIIGAGVQGLAAARTFVDLGYQIRIFEKLDGVGGTWHKKKSYPGLASHGPMKNLFRIFRVPRVSTKTNPS
jgi:dimethylaniline monooxygenase (N-oxide forming)